MKNGKWIPYVIVSACLVFGCPLALAKITIDPGFEGTLVITTPEGDIQLVEPGEPMPEIASGSVIEVFDGTFTLTTEPGDSVEVSCLEHDASVSNGASLALTCGENSGLVKVLLKAVILTDIEGQQFDLAEGAEYQIKVEDIGDEAPAAAAAEETGSSALDLPTEDSRDIQSSPGT